MKGLNCRRCQNPVPPSAVMRGKYEMAMQDAVGVYRFCDKEEEARHALCVAALYGRSTSGYWGLVSCLSQQAQKKRNSRST